MVGPEKKWVQMNMKISHLGHYYLICPVGPQPYYMTIKMKIPPCRTSREMMGYKTPRTTLTLALWPWPTTLTVVTLTPWPWTTFSDTRLETAIFYIGDLDLWPMTLAFTLVRDMMVLNACAKVKVRRFNSSACRAQPDRQTHRQADATENITSSAYASE